MTCRRISIITNPRKSVIQAISPNFEAVSIWFPPGTDHSEDTESEPFTEEDFADPGSIEKMLAVNDVIDALTENLGQEPQWYLHLVAVRP